VPRGRGRRSPSHTKAWKVAGGASLESARSMTGDCAVWLGQNRRHACQDASRSSGYRPSWASVCLTTRLLTDVNDCMHVDMSHR
jgi:hypothetical protein